MQIDFDKPRDLKFDLRAIKDLEANMGGTPLSDVIQQISRMGITAITTALWAGLKSEDKALNINLVTKMLQTYIDNGGAVRVLARAITDTIDASGLYKHDSDEVLEGNASPEAVTTTT